MTNDKFYDEFYVILYCIIDKIWGTTLMKEYAETLEDAVRLVNLRTVEGGYNFEVIPPKSKR